MEEQWIPFEILINIIETCTFFYLYCKKFEPKYKNSVFLTLTFMSFFAFYLSIQIVVDMPVLLSGEVVCILISIVYLLFTRKGNAMHKIFWVLFAYTLIIIIVYFSLTTISILSRIPGHELLTDGSNERLLAATLCQLLYIAVFYRLAKTKKQYEIIKGRYLVLCFFIPLISCIAMTYTHNALFYDATVNQPNKLIYIIASSFLVINLLVFALYELLNQEAEKRYDLIMRHTQYEVTEWHNQHIIEAYTKMQEWRHDYNNHMQLLVSLLNQSGCEDIHMKQAKEYMESLDEKITRTAMLVSTGNYLVDAILSSKMSLALSNQIAFQYEASLPELLPLIEHTELCALLSNLLDNAIEACCKLRDGRYINILIEQVKSQLHIELTNSSDGIYKQENKRLATTKQDSMHGFGLKRIQFITVKYNGLYQEEHLGDRFHTNISIPL